MISISKKLKEAVMNAAGQRNEVEQRDAQDAADVWYHAQLQREQADYVSKQMEKHAQYKNQMMANVYQNTLGNTFTTTTTHGGGGGSSSGWVTAVNWPATAVAIDPDLITMADLDNEAMRAPITTLIDVWRCRFGHEWVKQEEFKEERFYILAAKRLAACQMMEIHQIFDPSTTVYRLREDAGPQE